MPSERSERSVSFACLPHILKHQARRIPDAPAILAPGRAPLSYGRLYQHVEEMQGKLRSLGIGRQDRVAVVLPNGPEMASAFLTVAASAVCAPMNPAYGAEELDRYFADLRLRALITESGTDSPARRAALSHGVRVIELSTSADTEAGLFALTGDEGDAQSRDSVSPNDVALLLPTSGTTARPKIVPLTHLNICASAYGSVAALALTEADRCLSLLPLFYGQGLNATVLASLAAGSSLVCAPGCDVTRFFAWLSEFRPTWCAAVPSMLQAILAHARLSGEEVVGCPLRFFRSASAPLPPRTFMELERTFATPVIEWYGMTEAASTPIAINPLPPRQRKAGSVGVPGPGALEVAIMDERGNFLSGGQTGEVVIRGASVTTGYDGNPSATEAAFSGDWFKTGDLGHFDEDGYLFLTGRSREMINRGGEKIAPREVDEILLEHPAVAEAVSFAVPHATLGEDVASAIVLRPHAVASARDIRQFASARLADFKVPRRVLIVSEIPKGPTGKAQRIGLAAKLGLAAASALPQPFAAPRTPLEEVLAKGWAEILQVERIGIHDDFFASGGDSLLAMQVLRHVYQVAQVRLEVASFFAAPTVADVADHVGTLMRSDQAPRPPLAVVPVPRENATMAASVAQERLWKLQHELSDIPFFNVIHALRSTSMIDIAILERSVNEIVARHEILRTSFGLVEGRCVQVIAPELTIPVVLEDLRHVPRGKRDTMARRIIREEALHSFDLTKGPLIRARLLRLAEREHLFLVSTHQVVCDGWSLGVLVDELIALYDVFSNGEESPLPPLSIQFADFAHWQRHWHLNPELVAQLEYWLEQLRDPLPATWLARAAPRRAIDDLRTARREWTLPATLVESAKRFSHEEGGTLFMALVAALSTLLRRHLGQDDVRVATNIANRHRPGAEVLIGPLVNTVLLRTNLGGDPSLREVLRRVRAAALAAFAHTDLPFDELVQTLERDRGIERRSLSNAMLLLQNATLRPAPKAARKLAFVEATPSMLLPVVTMTSFDVIFALTENPHGLAGTCVYKPHLFPIRTIDLLLRDFQEILDCMTRESDQPISAMRIFSKPAKTGGATTRLSVLQDSSAEA